MNNISSKGLFLFAILFAMQCVLGCKNHANRSAADSAINGVCPDKTVLLKEPDEETIEYWNNQVQTYPNCASLYLIRGNALNKKGDTERAMRDLAQGARLTEEAMGYLRSGSAFYEKGEYENSVQSLTQAISLKPDLALAYQARGLAYQKLAKNDLANEDFIRAKEWGFR